MELTPWHSRLKMKQCPNHTHFLKAILRKKIVYPSHQVPNIWCSCSNRWRPRSSNRSQSSWAADQSRADMAASATRPDHDTQTGQNTKHSHSKSQRPINFGSGRPALARHRHSGTDLGPGMMGVKWDDLFGKMVGKMGWKFGTTNLWFVKWMICWLQQPSGFFEPRKYLGWWFQLKWKNNTWQPKHQQSVALQVGRWMNMK